MTLDVILFEHSIKNYKIAVPKSPTFFILGNYRIQLVLNILNFEICELNQDENTIINLLT